MKKEVSYQQASEAAKQGDFYTVKDFFNREDICDFDMVLRKSLIMEAMKGYLEKLEHDPYTYYYEHFKQIANIPLFGYKR